LLTGNIGRPGAGVIPLRSGANSQGLLDMGVRPDRLPGGALPTDSEARAKVEAAWGTTLPAAGPGRTVGQMLAAAEAGELGLLYVVGNDPALSAADDVRTGAALAKVDCLILQDSFLTETAKYADVVLPSVVSTEDEGTFTNVERFVQRVRPVAPPVGEALPDWKIIQLLANALGGDWAYAGPADVMREISDVVWCYRGIGYDRLDDEGLQPPCPGVDHPGTAILHVTEFSRGKAAFAPVETGVTTTAVDADYPFVLLTGCVLEHHGTGVRSRRSPGLTSLVDEARLEINPADASTLGIADGDLVKVIGRTAAAIELAARVTGRVPEGAVFLPGFSATAPAARLFEWGASGHPAVRVEPVA
jgi:formate dehydrogenase major subunit